MNFPEKYQDADYIVEFKYNEEKNLGHFEIIINEKLQTNEKAIKIMNDLKMFFEKERTLVDLEKILNYMKTHKTSFVKEFANCLIKTIDSVWINYLLNQEDN